MITQTNNNPTSHPWRPVSVTVTLETKEEYKLLWGMLAYNVSVPEVVESSNESKLSDMMSELQMSFYRAAIEAGNPL